jgi:two-component system chemotaxis response regulator CheB
MLALMESGGETFAQTPETAAAPGMPAAAIGLNAVRHVLPPASIGMTLAGWFGEKAS